MSNEVHSPDLQLSASIAELIFPNMEDTSQLAECSEPMG